MGWGRAILAFLGFGPTHPQKNFPQRKEGLCQGTAQWPSRYCTGDWGQSQATKKVVYRKKASNFRLLQ